MKSNFVFILLSFAVTQFFGVEVMGQTYTSKANGNWNSASTWTITGTAGCSTVPSTPPNATNSRSCPIIININHNVNLSSSLTVGNNNTVSIQIANTKTLSIDDDLGITGYNNKKLNLSGSGMLEIGDDLISTGNSEISITGNLTIDVDKIVNVSQASTFKSNGNINITSKSANINGNGSLNFSAKTNTIFETTNQDFEIQNGAEVFFSGTSGIDSDRDLTISGYTPSVRFEDNSYIKAKRDLTIQGGAVLSMYDNSKIESHDDLFMENQSKLLIFNNSSVTISDKSTLSGGVEIVANESSKIEIGDDISISNQGNITLNGFSSLKVSGNTTLENGSKINGNADNKITIDGRLTLSDQSLVNLNGNSSLQVQDRATIDTNNPSAGLKLNGNSTGKFNSEVRLNRNASTLVSSGTSSITFKDDVKVRNGADVILQGNSTVTSEKDIILDNNYGTSWTNSQSVIVLVEGDFLKGRNSNLNVRNSSSFEITGSFPTEGSDPRIKVDSSPAYYGALRILPVEFLYFYADYQPETKSGLLTWATSKEWENSHFEIERGVNTINTWETVGRVEGNGYSEGPIEYSFTNDILPITRGNIFYRLKQVDFDGSYTYSSTRAIQAQNTSEAKTAWNVYPNPSSLGSEVNVKLIQPGSFQDGKIHVALSNLLGQIKSYYTSSPEEITSIISDWLNASASGLYILDISWGNQRQQVKLMRN
ncbi:T9SS type A sorting domain-containing protein [Algoriphagus antarcticus]|uniref:Uncharacterized protein n=1 Tax=Algoriphagus antarcticus TaxID=238540 RepID=A0A3E0DV65_9BACT|nr:T9SS type A sorting domain-containing protein [Algoriphagus antarcticus]REG88498.1 hypothetical protein C8N25_109113 [Algoriphagus antarcticus]